MTPQQIYDGIWAIIMGQMVGWLVSLFLLASAWKVK